MLSYEQVVRLLQLVPHADEGGYFRETYRSRLTLAAESLPDNYGGPRNAATAIYYLITPHEFSTLHRVASDEVFHFYAGDPLEMLQLEPAGSGRVVRLGNDLEAGLLPQMVVPAGVWQGCRLAPGGSWALMGCTVAPGFDYADFTAADREKLVAQYPDFAELIAALTRL